MRFVLKTIGRVSARAVNAATFAVRLGAATIKAPLSTTSVKVPLGTTSIRVTLGAALSAAALSIAALLAAVLVAGCGHSHRTSTHSDSPPQPFKLLVHTVRSETIYDPKTDSLSGVGFESRLTHFGHVENLYESGSTDRFIHTNRSDYADQFVYNDSIRFQTEKPYRLEAFMSIDTLFSRSKSSNSAISSETMGPSDSMLVCIFQGPALQITHTDDEPSLTVEHLKANCPGGIYRRLDLPRTYGLFVTAVPEKKTLEPPGRRDQWEQDKDMPSLSGLGYSPRLQLQYQVTGVEGDVLTVRISCDTTISNVSTFSPSGEKVDIIANRIQVAGTLRMVNGQVWHEGRIHVEEDVKYTRPALDTSVLTKRCVYEMSLERF